MESFGLENNEELDISYIFNLMQGHPNIIKFFDVRDEDSYNLCHIKNSIHIPPYVEDFNAEMIKQLTKEKEPSRLRRYCIIVSYDLNHSVRAGHFIQFLEFLKCKEIHRLEKIDEFMAKYYFLCSNYHLKSNLEFPNEIIPNFLYLGSQKQAHNNEIIELLEITHICNVTRTASCPFPNIKYCRVFVEDTETEKISLFFQRAYEFIEDALDTSVGTNKHKVLVHCAQGKSRSATIVIMFLMRALGMTLENAYRFTKKNRDFIEPNEGFMKDLQNFDENEHQFTRRWSINHFKKPEKVLVRHLTRKL